MDLRRVGAHPDFWHPVAWSDELVPGGMLAVSWAGLPVVLARPLQGELFALEDRCAHRQVPLSKGVLSGQTVRCGYHGWSFDREGKCVEVPMLGKAGPNGVRVFPAKESSGMVFIFPGDPALAATKAVPFAPAACDPEYRTRRLDRRIRCHYTFMHENLMDMNHQFLHRSLMGSIQPILLRYDKGEDWVEAVYRFERTSGAQSWGEKFMIGPKAKDNSVREHDVMTIRTSYPYQTLTFARSDSEKPGLDLWLSYEPVDKDQSSNRSFGLMSIKKPGVPGLIHAFWPFICMFTDGIFKQDQDIVEAEQRAWDEHQGDRNKEIFPLIRELRGVLERNGRPLA